MANLQHLIYMIALGASPVSSLFVPSDAGQPSSTALAAAAPAGRLVYIDLGTSWANTLRLFKDPKLQQEQPDDPRWEVYGFEASPLIWEYMETTTNWLNTDQAQPQPECPVPPTGSTGHLMKYAPKYSCPTDDEDKMRKCMWKALEAPLKALKPFEKFMSDPTAKTSRLAEAGTPNTGLRTRYTFVPAAVGIRDETIELWGPATQLIRGGSIGENQPGSPAGEENKLPEDIHTVPAVDFPKWLTSNFKKEDTVVLKMDVEGAEHQILRSLLDSGKFGELVDLLAWECHAWGEGGGSQANCEKLQKEMEATGVKVLVEDKDYDGWDTFSSPPTVANTENAVARTNTTALAQTKTTALAQTNATAPNNTAEAPAHKSPEGMPSLTDTKRPSFTVVVLGYSRPKGMTSLLKTLSAVNWGGDTIKLHICVDKPDAAAMAAKKSGWNTTLSLVDEFKWEHGPKEIRRWDVHMGLAKQWVSCFDPQDDKDWFGVFEDDLMVNPYFYDYFKDTKACHGGRSNLAGFTLSRCENLAMWASEQRMVSTSSFVASGEPFMHRVVGSWGFMPVPAKWMQFQSWVKNGRGFDSIQSYDPRIEGTKPGEWYGELQQEGKVGTMWTAHFIKWCYETDNYVLWPHLTDLTLISFSETKEGSEHGFRTERLFASQLQLLHEQKLVNLVFRNETGAPEANSPYKPTTNFLSSQKYTPQTCHQKVSKFGFKGEQLD